MTASHLDRVPLDFSSPAVRELRGVLADNYFRVAEVVDLVRQAGGSPALINWEQPATLVWTDVLDKMQKQAKLHALLDIVVAGPDSAVASRVGELTGARPVTAAPALGASPEWKEPTPGGYEKIIAGESTLLDIAFLQRGVELSAAVARLLVMLDGDPYFGTGFLIAPDLLLTNHHVLFGASGRPATAVDMWFGYERAFGGHTKAHYSVAGRLDSIDGDQMHDWAVVRLAGSPPEGAPTINLTDGGSVAIDDRVYVIQHPLGQVKKIGMIHNVVRYVNDDVIQYWTDTESGSSGSPVFNERWQLVALHHYYVVHRGGLTAEVRNQGRRIERVLAGLTTHELV